MIKAAAVAAEVLASFISAPRSGRRVDIMMFPSFARPTIFSKRCAFSPSVEREPKISLWHEFRSSRPATLMTNGEMK
jgi:hypothetical protein